MASVAICPHCYLQLIVPDGVESDELVECPTCAQAFGLDDAVVRTIPEVVRRSCATQRIERIEPAGQTPQASAVAADEVVEMEEIAFATEHERPSDVVDRIKAQIEAEIAADQLNPGTDKMLPLDLTADDAAESLTLANQEKEDLAARFRHADTIPELPAVAGSASEAMLEPEAEATATTPIAADFTANNAANEDVLADDAGEVDELVVSADRDMEPEPTESRATRPTVRTLADLLPPRDEVEEVPGPSFDLPNVPLSPSNGATEEIDPSMSFGPAAEAEFELDDVDFESTPAEGPVAEDVATEDSFADESAEASEPVFGEPEAVGISAAPFVLPALPPVKKKRGIVRMLVGTAIGGVVGLALADVALMYLKGPDGDLLRIAQYIPSALLPKSFHRAPTAVAKSAPESAPPISVAGDVPDEEKSANVPAGYVEEEKSPATHEAASDDRYGSEPSPLEEPTAEPIAAEKPNTTAARLPIHGPAFNAAQLASALEAGKEAQAGLVAGNLSDASVRRTKGMSYAKLCDLAEALTFVDPSSNSVASEQAIEGADRLFRETLADAHTRGEVARIAQIWIDSPHRGHGGIFLAGKLSGGQIAGDDYEYELTTDDGAKFTLLMHEPPDPLVEGSTHPVGIIGSIVDNPAGQVAGYRGTAKRAIWAARTIPLD